MVRTVVYVGIGIAYNVIEGIPQWMSVTHTVILPERRGENNCHTSRIQCRD